MLLTYLLLIAHIVVSLILILVVLLQTGKRADLAGAFGGGGSQTAFGARGAATFLSKATTWSAIIFMVTSIILGVRFGSESASSVVEEGDAPVPTAPAPVSPQPTPPPAPQQIPPPAQPPSGSPDGTAGAPPAPEGGAPAQEPPPAQAGK